MLKVIKTERGFVLDPGLRPPGVYLDYGVIADLADPDTDRGERLRQAVINKGTLYLSWAHFLELFGLGEGRTFKKILKYLNSFGSHFVILDSNPKKVIEREKRWRVGRQNPAIDEDFLGLVVAHWDERSKPTIGSLLEAMASEDGFFDGIKAAHTSHKDNLKVFFDGHRQMYRTNRAVKDEWDTIVRRSGSITERAFLELGQMCVRTQEEFKHSDVLDFQHAVVSLPYCQYVVLDRTWVARCRRLKIPNVAAVFRFGEIDKLIAALENPL